MLKRRFDYFLLSTFTICFPLICACQKATQAHAIWQPSVESERTALKPQPDGEAGKIGDTMADDTRHLRNGLGWQIEEAGGDAWTYGYWISRSVDNGTHWRRVSRFARHPFSPKPGELDVK